jgi:hypothetical protein
MMEVYHVSMSLLIASALSEVIDFSTMAKLYAQARAHKTKLLLFDLRVVPTDGKLFVLSVCRSHRSWKKEIQSGVHERAVKPEKLLSIRRGEPLKQKTHRTLAWGVLGSASDGLPFLLTHPVVFRSICNY